MAVENSQETVVRREGGADIVSEELIVDRTDVRRELEHMASL